jgi:hypothetical protein
VPPAIIHPPHPTVDTSVKKINGEEAITNQHINPAVARVNSKGWFDMTCGINPKVYGDGSKRHAPASKDAPETLKTGKKLKTPKETPTKAPKAETKVEVAAAAKKVATAGKKKSTFKGRGGRRDPGVSDDEAGGIDKDEYVALVKSTEEVVDELASNENDEDEEDEEGGADEDDEEDKGNETSRSLRWSENQKVTLARQMAAYSTRWSKFKLVRLPFAKKASTSTSLPQYT